MTPLGAVRHPIWLVRHASTAWTGVLWCGRADPPLDARGDAEAAALAAGLGPELPASTTILASPAERALATARALADGMPGGLPIEVDPELIEVDVGRVEGLTWGELSTREPALADAIVAGDRIDWPGGESGDAVDARAARAAARILEAASRAPVVVISHGAVLHAIARALEVRPLPPPLEPAAALRIAR